ncbi:hypothetical protein Kpol_1018p35 [Vanderwaltozyma polyspora DSM 70294]|uniref:C2H2-type domain-containing protein n=1 Tax=Vanderwaltozyma polyspora (strain ATCC 22028 / DSM 70294 / BCRC 21397 / CBS 2163 / NBRC 10782 / NRRL Y-8283 / UCD 57-17) TaxID=436907 RepID=A7TDN6_VANPO|nr:uncharacterized protein Kpol_1018p35 [Vanderwaltozyma polyspora DSM 70294]EDO19506.1 hypothetical protein Kpol_1018p35 [Vanderwaltozyma polyspora DSM 70294]
MNNGNPFDDKYFTQHQGKNADIDSLRNTSIIPKNSTPFNVNYNNTNNLSRSPTHVSNISGGLPKSGDCMPSNIYPTNNTITNRTNYNHDSTSNNINNSKIFQLVNNDSIQLPNGISSTSNLPNPNSKVSNSHQMLYQNYNNSNMHYRNNSSCGEFSSNHSIDCNGPMKPHLIRRRKTIDNSHRNNIIEPGFQTGINYDSGIMDKNHLSLEDIKFQNVGEVRPNIMKQKLPIMFPSLSGSPVMNSPFILNDNQSIERNSNYGNLLANFSNLPNHSQSFGHHGLSSTKDMSSGSHMIPNLKPSREEERSMKINDYVSKLDIVETGERMESMVNRHNDTDCNSKISSHGDGFRNDNIQSNSTNNGSSQKLNKNTIGDTSEEKSESDLKGLEETVESTLSNLMQSHDYSMVMDWLTHNFVRTYSLHQLQQSSSSTGSTGSSGDIDQKNMFQYPNKEKKQVSYQCPVCGKSVSRASSLHSHMFIHTNARPYKCQWEGCNKTFNVKSNLNRHTKLHIKKQQKK